MDPDPDEIVTSMPNLSGVRLTDIPAALASSIRRVLDASRREQHKVSAFSSSI